MPSTGAHKDRVRKATIDFVRSAHPRNDDEDMHPSHLDETEAKLESAIDKSKRSA